MQSTLNKLLVSKQESARILSISLRKVDYLIAHRELAVRKVGRRTLIRYSELERFCRRDHRSVSRAIDGVRD